jgi:hypothetical protein
MSTTSLDTLVNPQFAQLRLEEVTATFDSISGFSIDLGITGEPVGTTAQGDPLIAMRMAGQPQYGQLTCQAQLSQSNLSLFTWSKELQAGVVKPKNGTLTLMSADGSVQAAFDITGVVLANLTPSSHGLSSPTASTLDVTLNCLSYKRTR